MGDYSHDWVCICSPSCWVVSYSNHWAYTLCPTGRERSHSPSSQGGHIGILQEIASCTLVHTCFLDQGWARSSAWSPLSVLWCYQPGAGTVTSMSSLKYHRCAHWHHPFLKSHSALAMSKRQSQNTCLHPDMTWSHPGWMAAAAARQGQERRSWRRLVSEIYLRAAVSQGGSFALTILTKQNYKIESLRISRQWL